MKPLPVGYHFVAAVSMAYASLVLLAYGWIVKVTIDSQGPWFNDNIEFVLFLLFVSAPLTLFFGSVLMFNQQLKWLRFASLTLPVAGLLLLAKSGVVTWYVFDTMNRDPSGALMICAVPIVVVPATGFGITALVAGVLLFRRLRRPD